jgi:hypothetical protein
VCLNLNGIHSKNLRDLSLGCQTEAIIIDMAATSPKSAPSTTASTSGSGNIGGGSTTTTKRKVSPELGLAAAKWLRDNRRGVETLDGVIMGKRVILLPFLPTLSFPPPLLG